jgi:hypothetical protein
VTRVPPPSRDCATSGRVGHARGASGEGACGLWPAPGCEGAGQVVERWAFPERVGFSANQPRILEPAAVGV